MFMLAIPAPFLLKQYTYVRTYVRTVLSYTCAASAARSLQARRQLERSMTKRTLPDGTAGDRALKLRRTGQCRIPLDEIGFYPENRGGMGISPHHAHEIAHDCLAHTTKVSRYIEVNVVVLSPAILPAVLARNKKKCEDSNLMPDFSPEIKYAALTKTHFAHAHKLAKEHRHTLYDEKKYKSVGSAAT